jgi:hypothetical protein
MRVISAATFDQLKQQAEAVRRGRFTHKGTCYLSWTRAILELRVSSSPINQKAGPKSVVQPTSRDQLLNWRRGCPLLGRRLKAKLFKLREHGRGGPEYWFVEDDILRVKEALLSAIGKAQKGQGSFPSILRDLRIRAGLTQAELAKRVASVPTASVYGNKGGARRPRGRPNCSQRRSKPSPTSFAFPRPDLARRRRICASTGFSATATGGSSGSPSHRRRAGRGSATKRSRRIHPSCPPHSSTFSLRRSGSRRSGCSCLAQRASGGLPYTRTT